MQNEIRKMSLKDKPLVLEMMKTFYSSPAVSTNGSYEIFNSDIENCLSDSPYLEGYVFENQLGVLGYAMIAKSFSTEFGKPCVWIEDLFVKTEFQGQGVGRSFLDFITKKYPNHLFRLEVEKENEKAVKLYQSFDFSFLPYLEMKK